jgi:dihydroorotate dehydrogenase
MGFNNDGLEVVVRNLKKKHNNTLIIGGNIGKNKITPNEDAVTDYLLCFDALFPYVDYFVVNVSSPNTPNLRELQEKEPLMKLLSALVLKNNARDKPKPILLKIAPDLTNSQLDDIIDIVRQTRIDGIVATNTTISRDGLLAPPLKLQSIGAGGLSGKPLVARSTEVIRYISEKSAGSIPIIGVGGIHSPKDAIDKIEAGASLVQLYTGFVYEGPGIIKRINQEILRTRK